jgi:hypothetical protein
MSLGAPERLRGDGADEPELSLVFRSWQAEGDKCETEWLPLLKPQVTIRKDHEGQKDRRIFT